MFFTSWLYLLRMEIDSGGCLSATFVGIQLNIFEFLMRYMTCLSYFMTFSACFSAVSDNNFSLHFLVNIM